jgi:hypothetical protein
LPVTMLKGPRNFALLPPGLRYNQSIASGRGIRS